MTPRRLLPSFIAACGVALLLAGAAARAADTHVVTTERVRAELMGHAPDGIEPGKTVWVGLSIAHQPEWHTYWKNSGDSGLPTSLEWTLPPGVMAGDIAWPVPKKIPIGTLANYGYENTVLLPVQLLVTPDFKPSLLKSELEVKLRASWLVCRKECIPEDGDFTLRVPTRSSTGINGADFEAALASQPKALPAGSTVQIDGQLLKVSVTGLPEAVRGKTLEFFPEVPGVIETAGQWTQAWQGATWTADVPLSSQRSESPAQLPMVLALQDAKDRTGWRAEAPVSGTWPQGVAVAAVPAALTAALA
ncbi:MAG: protein-disulfide reductase, partial [Rubrivivax sp.]